MNSYETINWSEKTDDDVFEYLDTIPEAEHFAFLMWLAKHYPEIGIDWLDLFEDTRYQMPYEQNIAACQEFSAWCAEKFPDEYANRFEFIERDLCDYYLHNKNLEELRERIAFISCNPVPAMDTLTRRLLFQLLYHGYSEDAVSYAEAVWKPLYESEELFGNPAQPFMNTIYLDRLQQAYIELKNTGKSDFEGLYKLTVDLGFDDDQEHFELIKHALRNPVDIERIHESIMEGSDDHMYELNIHFIKHMWDTFKMPFILSDALWSIVATTLIFGKIDEVDHWFYVDAKTLVDHIDSRHDVMMSSNSLEIFGKVWGLHYIFSFFHTKQLLTDEDAANMAENLTYVRQKMIKYISEELWQVNFIHQWPENHLWSELKPMFEKTYQQPLEVAKVFVDDVCSNFEIPERIRAELKKESHNRNNENFIPSQTIPFVKTNADVGRNDPCPCGSGKKYKKCCMDKDTQ
jgi:uncharacterized protein YchJ